MRCTSTGVTAIPYARAKPRNQPSARGGSAPRPARLDEEYVAALAYLAKRPYGISHKYWPRFLVFVKSEIGSAMSRHIIVKNISANPVPEPLAESGFPDDPVGSLPHQNLDEPLRLAIEDGTIDALQLLNERPDRDSLVLGILFR